MQYSIFKAWKCGACVLDNLVIDYAFNNLNLIKLEAYVFRENIASIKVLEKNGFNFEEILRKDYNIKGVISDELIYSKWKNK